MTNTVKAPQQTGGPAGITIGDEFQVALEIITT